MLGGDDTVVLDGVLARSRGVIGRYPEPGQRYVFRFDRVRPRGIHMLGVRRPLLVEWWRDGEVYASETLRPWVGYARHLADTVVERRP